MISTDYILSYIFLYIYSFIEHMFLFYQHRYVHDRMHYRIRPVIASGNKSRQFIPPPEEDGGILAVLC